jgi:hypothetical protein
MIPPLLEGSLLPERNGAQGRRLTVWLITGAWVATIAGLWVLIGHASTDQLRDVLRRWQFWVLEAQFLLLIFLSVINVPVLLPSAMTLALVVSVAPKTNRIFYDEQIYQGIGQNLSDLKLAQMCNDGNVEYGRLTCAQGEYNKQLYGYPYLLSVAYQLAGVRESAAFAVNAIAAALCVCVVFLITTALTGQRQAGHYAAVVAALMPEQLRWSHTTAAEPTAALACAVAVLTALAFVRTRSAAALLWMVVASVFAMQFRPECLLVIPVVAMIVLLYLPGELKRPRFWCVCLVGLVLAGLLIGHMAAVRHEAWGATGDRMSTAFVSGNLRTNGWFYLGDERFPVVYSVLALAGLLTFRWQRSTFVAFMYFVAFWGIFLLFYAGSYSYGADDRFSLMTYPPIAIMAGIGTWTLVEAFTHERWVASGWPARIVMAALGVQFLLYVPFVRSIGEEAWGARADVAFAENVVKTLPRNSIVLTHNPTMFHLWQQSAVQASLAMTEPNFVESVLAPRYAGGIFFDWNYWCNVADPVQLSFCTAVLNRFPHSVVQEYRERNYVYTLYRLNVSPVESVGHSSGQYQRTNGHN